LDSTSQKRAARQKSAGLMGETSVKRPDAVPNGILLVSGDWRDRIVWDLSRLTFIRYPTGHNAPLAAIDLTGDITTCSGTWLHLWFINGDPLASVNTLVGQIGRSQHAVERDGPSTTSKYKI
jgi:hypothetical protein